MSFNSFPHVLIAFIVPSYVSKDRPLGVYFAADVPFFFQRNLGGPWAEIAIKITHMLGSECNFRNWIRNLGPLALNFGAQKHENSDPILDNFPTR